MTLREAILTQFPPLHAHKHPGLAALVGVVTGGFGLAIYFRSLRDLLPVELAAVLVVLGSVTAGAQPLRVAEFVVPVVGGSYGLLRARSSNRRRATPGTPAVAAGTGS